MIKLGYSSRWISWVVVVNDEVFCGSSCQPIEIQFFGSKRSQLKMSIFWLSKLIGWIPKQAEEFWSPPKIYLSKNIRAQHISGTKTIFKYFFQSFWKETNFPYWKSIPKNITLFLFFIISITHHSYSSGFSESLELFLFHKIRINGFDLVTSLPIWSFIQIYWTLEIISRSFGTRKKLDRCDSV